jgi:hypothetical protein
MALRPAPKRKTVDYEKLDELQKQIFGSEPTDADAPPSADVKAGSVTAKAKAEERRAVRSEKGGVQKANSGKSRAGAKTKKEFVSPISQSAEAGQRTEGEAELADPLRDNLKDMETIAARIVSTRAGQGRSTTRPFSVPRTLIIDTTRLKAKFRTIDEQFTQNVIIDFLLREALVVATPENYRELRAAAFDSVKRPEETTRRSLTVTEEVVYQMSELKAGINLETGRKYSNDEIFSTLLAVGVSSLYRNGVLS